MAEVTPAEPGLRSLLAIPDFRRLWLGQIVSDFGDNLTFVTLLFVVQRLTGSTVALAGLAIATTLPSLIFGLVSGAYADRLDRKRVMVISDTIRGLVVLGFMFVQNADLIWIVYVLAFTQAAVGTLFDPAKGALMPQIVPEDQLLAANSLSQTTGIIFNLLGTAAAGIFAGLSEDLWPAFLLDGVTFFLSAALVSRISISGTPERTDQTRVLSDLGAGLRVILASRPLIGTLLAASIAMLGLGAVNVLFVPLIVDDLMVSESWFGAIEASQVAGMIIAGVLVAALASKFRPTTLISVGLVVIGGAITTVSRATTVWHLMIILVFVGLAITPLQASVSTLSQILIPDAMRGRVGGTLSALISTATITSMGLAGVLAAAIGVRSVFVAAGVVTIGAGVAAALVYRGTDTSPVSRETAEQGT